jgi:uncharacterized protein YggE
MSSQLFSGLCACALFLISVVPTYGQTPAPGSSQQSVVNVTGSADITKAPEVIRLQIKQYGKGNDTEAAKLALANAEKKLLKAIGDAGAEVIVATAGASMTSSYRSRYTNDLQMMRMRRQAAGGGIVAAEPVDPNKPLPTILDRYVVIDLKPTNKQKEIMAIVLELQEKLRKDHMELSGLSAVLTDEQNTDAARDLIQRNENYYANQSEVKIFLAGKITKKERLDLYAAAFKRAKATAQELAEAAGCQLGGLQSISSSNANFVNNYNATYYANSNNTAVILSNGEVMRRSPFKDDPEIETTVMRQFNYGQTGQYDPLTYQVTINVTYRLETGK